MEQLNRGRHETGRQTEFQKEVKIKRGINGVRPQENKINVLKPYLEWRLGGRLGKDQISGEYPYVMIYIQLIIIIVYLPIDIIKMI